MSSLICRPLITEKNTFQSAAGIYVFEVARAASKPEIKKAIEKSFGVKVSTVNTVTARGRSKTNKYGKGRVPYYKKAFVKLRAGEKIALFEGV